MSSSFCPRICIYQNDGKGRDQYISSNNAGFYKDYTIYNHPRTREPFIIPRKAAKSVVSKPLNRYSCDGNGRDLYIFRGNSRNLNVSHSEVELKDILRNEAVDLSPKSKGSLMQTVQQKNGISSGNKGIVDNLLNRIFYGTAEGISDRKMSPKVKFNKGNFLITDLPMESGLNKFRKSHGMRVKKSIITEEEFLSGMKTINGYKRKVHFFRAYPN